MKYIRTKDNIYENNGLIQSNSTVEENAIIVCGGHFAIPISNIIKQADTIEELCDMFVIWQEGCNIPVEMPLTEKEQYEKMKKIVSIGIKAKMNIWLKVAIWTDKGLIYVAKLNEKGELELI